MAVEFEPQRLADALGIRGEPSWRKSTTATATGEPVEEGGQGDRGRAASGKVEFDGPLGRLPKAIAGRVHHYGAAVSTSVVLSVTPAVPIDPDRRTVEVPDDIAAALTAAGQPLAPGLWVPHSGPVRLLFQLSGRDRVSAGQRLLEEVRRMGYEADLSFSP